MNTQDLLSQARVLVVDDSKMMRMGISRSLQQLGITRIEQADHGQLALERLRAEPFDLMLLDVEMPKWKCCRICSKMLCSKAFP
ncbi:MAG: Adenylate cyclase [Pseudomonadota bacterium]